MRRANGRRRGRDRATGHWANPARLYPPPPRRALLRGQAVGASRNPDSVRVLPGLPLLPASSDPEAAALRAELEAAASSEFNLADLITEHFGLPRSLARAGEPGWPSGGLAKD